MKKKVAIILIVVAVVLCSCPSLAFGGINLITASSPEMAATMVALGAKTIGQPAPTAADPMSAIFLGGCVICIGVIIPVVVALVTLRMARKKEAQSLQP
jgi:hypothetical protein